MKQFDVVYADPPWDYGDDTSNKLGSSKAHYPSMSPEELQALPVPALCTPDATMFMWSTARMLPQALELTKAWGFKFKTIAFVWIKLSSKQNPVAVMSMWTHSCAEFVLVGTRGRHRRVGLGVKQLVMEQRTKHSEKPDTFRQRIVELMGDVPRIELFARSAAPGWDAWGNEGVKTLELNSATA